MDRDASFASTMTESRAASRDQFRSVSALVQPFEQEQRLILATTPNGFEIDDQGNHEAPWVLGCCSASTSWPSFWNFRRTPRAAIRAMSAPRWPSRKPAPRMK